jgi:hypothetical protein
MGKFLFLGLLTSWALSTVLHSEGTQQFGNCICFHPSLHLGPLERTDFNHWTRSSFQNVVFSLNTRLLTGSKNEVIPSIIYHHQNPVKLVYVVMFSCSMIAAVGLVESNSVNIVAAMLVSPLMVRVPVIPTQFLII